MSEPSAPAPKGLARLVDALDKPLLVLAVVAVGLYLLELRGLVDPQGPARVLSMALDVVFLGDVVLKAATQRGRYLTSAWIGVDVLSCLPAISLLGHLPFLEAIRFTRLFRFLRVLRSVRMLRALHLVPALERFAADAAKNAEGRTFRIALNVGVVLYALAFLGVLGWVDLHQSAAQAASTEFFLVVGALLATALFVAVMHFQLQDASLGQIRALLNIALPRQVADHFMSHPEAFHDKGRGEATVLFMDFVGFTATVERLGTDVQALSDHLEAVMDCVVEALVAQDLIIDKFIGDAVMAFRGGPLVSGDPDEHARRVVKAALDGRRALLALKDPFFTKVKIGGASDVCLIGAFGTSRRLSYTVLGDGVNLAARLEPASGHCATEALFCDATRKRCGDDPAVVWRRWGRIRVKGKAEPQLVHEALDPRDLTGREFLATFEEALTAFEIKRIAEARAAFAKADEQRPGGDPPSRFYVRWCDELLARGVPSDFEPALTVAK